MIANIIHKQILSHNDTNLLPVYYYGDPHNDAQIIAAKLRRKALRAALAIDAAIVSTWQN